MHRLAGDVRLVALGWWRGVEGGVLLRQALFLDQKGQYVLDLEAWTKTEEQRWAAALVLRL